MRRLQQEGRRPKPPPFFMWRSKSRSPGRKSPGLQEVWVRVSAFHRSEIERPPRTEWRPGAVRAKNLPPGGDYAEQKAETGCERESHMRVLLACLMRFLIGISCHVCGAAKLLSGLARHVIR